MAKHITLEYEGITYTLEFNRRTARMMEQNGFTTEKAVEQALTYLPMLFAGAFEMHHGRMKNKQAVIDSIFKGITKKDELYPVLIELFQEPYVYLMDEPEDEEKKVEWKMEN